MIEFSKLPQFDPNSSPRDFKLLKQAACHSKSVRPAPWVLCCQPNGLTPVASAYPAPDAPALALVELIRERDDEAVGLHWAVGTRPSGSLALAAQRVGAASRFGEPLVACGVDASSVAVYSSF